MSYDAEKERLEELGKPRLGTIRHLYHVLYNINTQLGHKNQGVLKQQFTFCLFSEVNSLFLYPILSALIIFANGESCTGVFS